MNVLIIEDEKKLANHLKKLLQLIDGKINVVSIIGSVESAVIIIPVLESIDIILADIYLSDGLSFEIFKQIEVNTPIIFCTAYDQYALQAFELDSIDYLLKPIKQTDLERAITKYKRIFSSENQDYDLQERIQSLLEKLSNKPTYKKNFLLTSGNRLIPIDVNEIGYFQAEYGAAKCYTQNNNLYAMDTSLDKIELELDPKDFFRANRQFIVNKNAIIDIEPYFNGRLYVNIDPKPKESVIISKAKATEFKKWVNGI
ncbi:MAG: LytTR family DNA-binding domain-containing protein [Bacteroidota bacterium]